jgi:hypothetical protein
VACGGPLRGYRADAAYCSSPCRQSAYRARQRVTAISVTEDDLPERDFIIAAACLSDDSFDQALAAARSAGDLSRRGVARFFPASRNDHLPDAQP